MEKRTSVPSTLSGLQRALRQRKEDLNSAYSTDDEKSIDQVEVDQKRAEALRKLEGRDRAEGERSPKAEEPSEKFRVQLENGTMDDYSVPELKAIALECNIYTEDDGYVYRFICNGARAPSGPKRIAKGFGRYTFPTTFDEEVILPGVCVISTALDPQLEELLEDEIACSGPTRGNLNMIANVIKSHIQHLNREVYSIHIEDKNKVWVEFPEAPDEWWTDWADIKKMVVVLCKIDNNVTDDQVLEQLTAGKDSNQLLSSMFTPEFDWECDAEELYFHATHPDWDLDADTVKIKAEGQFFDAPGKDESGINTAISDYFRFTIKSTTEFFMAWFDEEEGIDEHTLPWFAEMLKAWNLDWEI